MKSQARVVIIGGGVAGTSTLYHLAERGWTDCMLLEMDELTSGSTWHAAGNIPTFSGSRNMIKLQHYSTQLYAELMDDRSEMADLEAMLDDPEMGPMAKEEIQNLKDSLPELEKEVSLLLLPKDKDDNASIVLEIRAGTGGDEAAIFAGDLFAMYDRYAKLQGWKVEIETTNEADMGGYKEIVASVTGAGAYGMMKFESGVHRVQRVPVTETQGRIHTSAATVAVLPEVEDIDIGFSMGDVRVDTMRASGAGGQHVNKTDSAVRMTHIPTGVVVVCDAKSQHMNRANAERLIKMKLYDMEKQRVDADRAEERAGQIGSGDRSERIRTYNYPQGRVTDHRINLTLYNLDKIVAGDALPDVINALISEDQASRLAQMEQG